MMDKEWLKITRIRLGLTGKDVADMMFTTKQTISNIETGKTKTKMVMVFYELTLNNLIKERGPLRDIF